MYGVKSEIIWFDFQHLSARNLWWNCPCMERLEGFHVFSSPEILFSYMLDFSNWHYPNSSYLQLRALSLYFCNENLIRNLMLTYSKKICVPIVKKIFFLISYRCSDFIAIYTNCLSVTQYHISIWTIEPNQRQSRRPIPWGIGSGTNNSKWVTMTMFPASPVPAIPRTIRSVFFFFFFLKSDLVNFMEVFFFSKKITVKLNLAI